MTTNNSSTGGYLIANPIGPFPPGTLTFTEFLQSVFAGVSGFDGTLVRPKWQQNPPKRPGIEENWIAFGIAGMMGDANAAVTIDISGVVNEMRHEDLEIQASVYGPLCYENTTALRDGFQIQQNLEGLRSANMGFVGTGRSIHIPEQVNERWYDRYEISFYFRREIIRVYPILTFISATLQTIANNAGTQTFVNNSTIVEES